mmetsp:Transcript_12667/g.23003  ORF Transcript_12667/g.23003 Transcript_12667/m.23003 type:complete len:108 (+) Transcript_12667:448-771(+)
MCLVELSRMRTHVWKSLCRSWQHEHLINPIQWEPLPCWKDHVTVVNHKGKRKQTCLVLRGLDLVDGTPVYDMKLFVPWDQIGCSVPNSNGNTNDLCHFCMTQLKVLS